MSKKSHEYLLAYYKTIKRSVSKLIDKQYPQDEFVLDDDIIVLTKVDIRPNNEEGETDASDEDELEIIYNAEEEFADTEDDFESDLEDFLDDRPESELSEESDGKSSDAEEGEGREYCSSESEEESGNGSGHDNESDNENHSQSQSAIESQSETHSEKNENENKNGIGTADEVNSENEKGLSDDDDEDSIKSPRKRAKLSFISDDDTSSESGNDEMEESDESSSAYDEPSPTPIASTSIPAEYRKDENKFSVYLLPFIAQTRTCLRYHGRIGMNGIPGIYKQMTKKKFCELIAAKRVRDGFTRLNLLKVNARHLEHPYKLKSHLPSPVRRFLIYIIDQWFPAGIPLEIHLNRAIDLLERLREKIKAGKVPSLKYSNKFYELIPHHGDPRRRSRFKDVKFCNNKIKYVQTMKSATECFSAFNQRIDVNPLDHFIEKWLRIELKVLQPGDNAYEVLNEVVENTQHAETDCRFCVKDIFKVDSMNSEANGDFSTDITSNHRYLFHFSFASNLPSILREGLLVAPKHIHSVNRFFGEGIYFWDAIANAGLNYTSINLVHVLVCRVALGREQQVEQQYLKHHETFDWNEDVDSIYCLGKEFSSARNDEKELDGAKIFCGKLDKKTNDSAHRYSLYNEYVIRNKNQAIVEYIIKLEKE